MNKRFLFGGLGLMAIGGLAQGSLAFAHDNGKMHEHGKNEFRGKELPAFDCATSKGNWHFDGLQGPFTTKAIKNFQKAKGLKVDGVVGPSTSKALGIPFTRTLRCGMGGSDVLLVQRRLEAEGFWEGMKMPAPTPKPRKTPRPTPMPTPMATPTPEMTPEPTPTPEMTPEPTPTPEETMAPESPPWLELSVGNWGTFIGTPPTLPGGQQPGITDYLTNGTWTTTDSLWFGDFGLGFHGTYFSLPVGFVGTPGTLLYHPKLQYRFPNWVFGLGYRGYTTLGYGAPSLSAGFDYPLFTDWLRLKVNVDGGYDLFTGSGHNYVDGMAALGLGGRPLGLDLGYRYMYYTAPGATAGAAPDTNGLHGPTVSVKLAF